MLVLIIGLWRKQQKFSFSVPFCSKMSVHVPEFVSFGLMCYRDTNQIIYNCPCRPWLDSIAHEIRVRDTLGENLVVSCSALKRVYRERLKTKSGCNLHLVLLDGDRNDIFQRMSLRYVSTFCTDAIGIFAAVFIDVFWMQNLGT